MVHAHTHTKPLFGAEAVSSYVEALCPELALQEATSDSFISAMPSALQTKGRQPDRYLHGLL